MTEPRPQGAAQMFEYLRADLKELREETNQKIDKLGDTLGSKIDKLSDVFAQHATDDNSNFNSLDKRVANIEVALTAREKQSDRGFTRFEGYTGLIVAIAAVVVSVWAILHN